MAAITPMFSAYVVVPDPPPSPARVVAMPSASSARPVSGSRSLPVIAATDFTWPTFSATRTNTTGTNSPSTARLKVGVVNVGSPNQPAARTAVKSTSPRSTATAYPTSTPTRIESRPRIPLNRTVTSTIARSVASPVKGAARNPLVHDSTIFPPTTDWLHVPHATGARLRPISATIVPVTTGGITTSIQRDPARCTTRPTTASRSPVTMTPPRATDFPPVAVAARIGAMNAKLEPR